MALKLVRKKKAKPAAGGRRKKSEIEKFKDAVDVQLRVASGEKVKKGRGLAKSWLEEGKEFGVVDMKQKQPPIKELKELRQLAEDGKLSNRIYMALRKPKKAVAPKKKDL
jgi:hypothetical protein